MSDSGSTPCPRCGRPLEQGRLIGGQEWLFWHPPPYRTGILGFKKDLEIVKDPRPWKRQREPVAALRCPECRFVQFSY